MQLQILFLEDKQEAQMAISNSLQCKYNIKFVSELGSFNDFLYNDEGYQSHDVIIIDASMDLDGYTEEEIKDLIPYFNTTDFVPSGVVAGLPLWGLDYFKHVVAIRAETQDMLNEGRIILFTGHASKLIHYGLFKQEEYPDTQLINRGEADSEKKLITMLEEIQTQLRK